MTLIEEKGISRKEDDEIIFSDDHLECIIRNNFVTNDVAYITTDQNADFTDCTVYVLKKLKEQIVNTNLIIKELVKKSFDKDKYIADLHSELESLYQNFDRIGKIDQLVVGSNTNYLTIEIENILEDLSKQKGDFHLYYVIPYTGNKTTEYTKDRYIEKFKLFPKGRELEDRIHILTTQEYLDARADSFNHYSKTVMSKDVEVYAIKESRLAFKDLSRTIAKMNSENNKN